MSITRILTKAGGTSIIAGDLEVTGTLGVDQINLSSDSTPLSYFSQKTLSPPDLKFGSSVDGVTVQHTWPIIGKCTYTRIQGETAGTPAHIYGHVSFRWTSRDGSGLDSDQMIVTCNLPKTLNANLADTAFPVSAIKGDAPLTAAQPMALLNTGTNAFKLIWTYPWVTKLTKPNDLVKKAHITDDTGFVSFSFYYHENSTP